MKKTIAILLTVVLLAFFSACQKKAEQTSSKKPVLEGPIIDSPASVPSHGSIEKKTEFQIVVPPDVKENWTAVTLVLTDNKENTTKEYTVEIGEELDIPNSGLTVKIGPFLPDFKMNAETITSSSDKPENPSVAIAVSENGKQIFPASGQWGWLYSKFPTIHPFAHERFSLTLKEGVRKQ